MTDERDVDHAGIGMLGLTKSESCAIAAEAHHGQSVAEMYPEVYGPDAKLVWHGALVTLASLPVDAEHVDKATAEVRLLACQKCPQRSGAQCRLSGGCDSGACGRHLFEWPTFKTATCPDKRW